jgi:hypothetical protein
MTPKTVKIITYTVIGLLTIGAGYAGYHFLIKKPASNTDPAAANTYEGKITALINKMLTYTSTDRDALIRAKLAVADRNRLLYLVKQYNDGATMTQTEKQELYQLMNLTFGNN